MKNSFQKKKPSALFLFLFLFGLMTISLSLLNISHASIYPKGETDSYESFDDYFDDPAIWVTKNPKESLILGTHKKEGVFVYNLEGRLLHTVKMKKTNNIDVFSGPSARGKIIEGAVLSIKGKGLQFFKLSQSFPYLKKSSPLIKTEVKSYGICSMVFKGDIYVAVTGKKGNAQVFVYQKKGERLVLKENQILDIDTKNEGCVFNQKTGDLFIAEEERGLWKWELSNKYDAYGEGKLIAEVPQFDLAADLEGLAIYNAGGVELLIVSVQSKNHFALFDLNGQHDYRGSFSIKASKGIDGVSHTDGIASTSLNLGPLYPMGLFVVQDNENYDLEKGFTGQNFKLVSWDIILSQF